MNILEIIKENDKIPRGTSFITWDKKFLCLNYASIGEESYNRYFNRLDFEERTYSKVIKLELLTDFINELPSNILLFQNLKEINIKGSRFWNLDMTQIPNTVEILYLTEHSNLSAECINGMDELINLSAIYLDFDTFKFFNIFIDSDYYNLNNDNSNSDIIPIPNLPKLKFITFCSGTFYKKESLKNDWLTIFKDHQLFRDIKNRISSVEIDYSTDFDIKMTLKNIMVVS
jgi:hypothetical protein